VVVVGLALLAIASARCPNACSGHGDCGASDKCTCWPNWQGFDCSERTCEFDIAWATDYRQDAHYYAECSGKGICDRSTGLCVCFDGYTGSACKRSVCPNDCSGHGKCRLVSELPQATSAQSFSSLTALASDHIRDPGSAYPYAGWDGDKIQACVCDGEFFGPDCSLRRCPRGDDPLTVCAETDTHANDRQIQRLVLSSTPGSGGDNLLASGIVDYVAGDLVLHFTDNHGEVWTTGRINEPYTDDTVGNTNAGAILIENALEALPNYKIPDVEVELEAVATSGAASSITFAVTFSNERTSGNQQLLACDPLPLGCVTAGCSPMYQQPANFRLPAGTGATQFDISAYYYEWAASVEISGGGADPSSGTPSTTAPAGWTTNFNSGDNIITSDSIFDNSASGANVDQARVTVVVFKAGFNPDTTYYPYYFVQWDLAPTGAIAAPAASVVPDGSSRPYSTPTLVPTGYNTPGSDYTSGSTGVGYNHVPIGYGLYVDLKSYTASMTNSGVDAISVFVFDVATLRCSVSELQRSDEMYEDLECSGRGVCDHSTGTCSCFEGHYGDHCSLQTILV